MSRTAPYGSTVVTVLNTAQTGATFAQLQAYISAWLGDPALTPERIAVANNVSLRTLHRIFQANDTTVAGWIRQRRLDRCRRDLTNLALADRPVRAIATRWGFVDAAHFSRAFKAAYGTSPAAYRERSSARQ
jgi:transcriptional regulator GlxA family with amidase domain